MSVFVPPPNDQEVLLDATGVLVECGFHIISNSPGATLDILVNSYLGAALNFASETGASASSVQTAFRKAAEIVPEVFRHRAKMVASAAADEENARKGSPIVMPAGDPHWRKI